LDRLWPFKLVPASEYLDLDWARDGLIRMCEHTGIGDVTDLRRATDGDDDVNPAYRHHPYTVMEHPRFVEPADVAALAAALRVIDLDQVFSRLPSDPQAVKEPLGGNLTDLISDPRPYLTKHFTAVRDFYTSAADEHLAIVIWCG
jgi:hypothetical protein